MKHLLMFCFLVVFATVSGCKKEEETTSAHDQFTDKLTLGTGMSGFTITNETTTFAPVGGNANMYWRLECKDDYGNQGAKLQIDKNISGTFTPYRTITPTVLQDYGHIYVNGPNAFADAGTYRATGCHIGSGRVVATVDFTIN